MWAGRRSAVVGSITLLAFLQTPAAPSNQPAQANPRPPTFVTGVRSAGWQHLAGGFPVTYTTVQAARIGPGQLSPPVIDTTHGQILEVLPGANAPNTQPTSYQDRLGIWQSGQWSFSSLPPGFRAMVFDGAPDRQEVIAIGQQAKPSQTTVPLYSDRAWKWDGKAWQPLQDGTPYTLPGPTWLVYDPFSNKVDLISYGSGALEPVNAPGYVHSELGDQGSWKVLQCGGSLDPFDNSWQSCGLPNVPDPTLSFRAAVAVTYGHVSLLGYDPRLGTTLFFGTDAVGGAPTSLDLNSGGYFQRVSLGASSLPAGSWAGTFAFLDHTLWITGYRSDGSFHMYRDDGGGFREVTSTAIPPPSPVPPQAFAESSDATIQANLLYGSILPDLWTSNLVYDPSAGQLIWLAYGSPKWSQWNRCPSNLPAAGYCPGPPFGVVTLQASTWTISTVSDQPKEPCTRVAIENSKDGGITLFSIANQQKSSIEKSFRSDGLFNITASSESDIGIEQMVGVQSLQATLDTTVHLDFRDDQRTFWFDESTAEQAIQYANEWGIVSAADRAKWIGRLNLVSSPTGLGVSAYGGMGTIVDGRPVGVDAGANAVVLVAKSTNPHTHDISWQGFGLFHAEGGASGGVSGSPASIGEALTAGDAVLTVTYTTDSNQNPKQLSLEIVAVTSTPGNLTGSVDGWLTRGPASFQVGLGGAASGDVVDATLNLDLTPLANQDLERRLMQSLTNPTQLTQVILEIAKRSEFLLAVEKVTESSSPGVDVKFGLGEGLTFHYQFGNTSTNTVLNKAWYATPGQGIQEWTDCENGTTHASDTNY